MNLIDKILLALEQGINLERLLKASGIDKDTLMLKIQTNQFTYDERIELKREIQDWEDGK